MLEHSIYSVISPEGCASILWRDPNKAAEAANAMKLSARDLLKFNIIDEIIEEPLGGAHRDRDQIILSTKSVLKRNLEEFDQLSRDEIARQRRLKFLNIGRIKGFKKEISDEKRLDIKKSNFIYLNNLYAKYKTKLTIIFALIVFFILILYFI